MRASELKNWLETRMKTLNHDFEVKILRPDFEKQSVEIVNAQKHYIVKDSHLKIEKDEMFVLIL